MNSSKEKSLAILIGTILVLGVLLFAVWHWFWSPLQETNNQISGTQLIVNKKLADMAALRKEKDRLAKLVDKSLPPNLSNATAIYEAYLRDLFEHNRVTWNSMYVQLPSENKNSGKKEAAKHKVLEFVLDLTASEESLVKFLDALDRTPTIHRVKTIDIERAEKKDFTIPNPRLNVKMTLEAMVLSGAKDNPEFRLEPIDVSAVEQANPKRRDYTVIPYKNIFGGYFPPAPPPVTGPVAPKKIDNPPPPPFSGVDVTQYVRLAAIEMVKGEAVLRNMLSPFTSNAERTKNGNTNPKLSDFDRTFGKTVGHETFAVKDTTERFTLAKIRIVHLDQRDIYFIALADDMHPKNVEGKVFKMHMGDSLADAYRSPVADVEMQTSGILKKAQDAATASKIRLVLNPTTSVADMLNPLAKISNAKDFMTKFDMNEDGKVTHDEFMTMSMLQARKAFDAMFPDAKEETAEADTDIKDFIASMSPPTAVGGVRGGLGTGGLAAGGRGNVPAGNGAVEVVGDPDADAGALDGGVVGAGGKAGGFGKAGGGKMGGAAGGFGKMGGGKAGGKGKGGGAGASARAPATTTPQTFVSDAELTRQPAADAVIEVLPAAKDR